MPFAFEKLIVYQKAVTFADACCSLTRGFPRGYFFLADQLNRAALSIAANIAEVFGQLCRYMGWVGENLIQMDGVPVAGIIIAAEITPKLEAATKTNANVRLVEYAIRLHLSPKERTHGD